MIIGLIGAPGAGKDTVADFFVEHKSFKRLAFADKIKEGYYAETGYSEEQFKLARGTILEQQIREGLWEYSARIKKEFGQAYFIHQVIENIGKNDIIVTDVRTDLELFMLEKDCKARMVVVLRNFKEELKGKILPGTKLKLSKIINYPKFWNIQNSLDETYIELYKFFEELQEIDMDPDGESFTK
ncbi:MAG: hypothetical protein WC516_05400 [Patescibacteria group bacterium]|jgi:hypothetical protein